MRFFLLIMLLASCGQSVDIPSQRSGEISSLDGPTVPIDPTRREPSQAQIAKDVQAIVQGMMRAQVGY